MWYLKLMSHGAQVSSQCRDKCHSLLNTPPLLLVTSLFLFYFHTALRILACICLHRNSGSKQIINVKKKKKSNPLLSPSVQELGSYRVEVPIRLSKLPKKAIISHNRKKMASFYNMIRSLYSSPSPSSALYLLFAT